MLSVYLPLSHLQIVTDQQTGQKIQIVTAMNPSSAPKQQFILATADSSGASKVILTSPETHNTKQVIFTAADNLMPGRIQVHFCHIITPKLLILGKSSVESQLCCSCFRPIMLMLKLEQVKLKVLLFQIVTDPLSMERLLGQSADLSRPQPVEYCVVCGDKASGS